MNRKPYTILFTHHRDPNNGNLVTGQIIYACSADEAEQVVMTDNPGATIVMIAQTEDREATFDKYFKTRRRFTDPITPVYVLVVKTKEVNT